MKKKRNDDVEFLDVPTFESEVPVDDLQDVRFKEKKKARRMLILVILIVIFSLLLIAMGIYYSIKGGTTNWNTTNADLFVVHSKVDFGDMINNVNDFKSEDDAYSYTFYVENQNDINLMYKVVVEDDYDNNIGVKKFIKRNINYSIYKNNERVFKGVFTEKNSHVLTTTKIIPGQIDNYEIKLWTSASSADDGYYKFKVKVGLQDWKGDIK